MQQHHRGGRQTPLGVPRGASSPILFTWLIEAEVWQPWTRIGQAKGWGVDEDGSQLMRLTWADDGIMIARTTKMMREMWDTAVQLMRPPDSPSTPATTTSVASGTPTARSGQQTRPVERTPSKSWATFRRGSDGETTAARVLAATKAYRGYGIAPIGATEQTIKQYLVHWRRARCGSIGDDTKRRGSSSRRDGLSRRRHRRTLVGS